MKNARVAAAQPRKWRGGREIGGRRVWMPVTDSWIGSGDSRLWNRYADETPVGTETWLDQLRFR